MASRELFVSEELRSALEVRIRGLTSADMREICKDYGVDDSGTPRALQKECISLLDEMMSTRDDSGIDEFRNRIFRLAHAPLQDFPQRHTGLQQFSGVTALDSSRFHAGNSYVEHQNNYYAPTTPTPQAPNNEYPERVQNRSAY